MVYVDVSTFYHITKCKIKGKNGEKVNENTGDLMVNINKSKQIAIGKNIKRQNARKKDNGIKRRERQ